MRDHRRVFIPDPDPKSSDGFATFAAWIIGGVMTVALIDRGMTIAWHVLSQRWQPITFF